jgi:hypothetical protein
MSFADLLASIDKNPFKNSCPTPFTQKKRDMITLTKTDTQWGASKRPLDPPRLTTAWLSLEDPLMVIAGPNYRATEVRDKSFALQEEALSVLRGNRKLTKAKMGDALSSMKPNEDQTKVIARILLALKHVQTVCYNEEKKTVWTMPEDLRAWSTSLRTIWIDNRAEHFLDFSDSPPLGLGAWLSEREDDGWKIEWPVSEESYEDMKRIALEKGITVRPLEGTKPKKDDFARVLGRHYAIQHLS